VINGVAPPSNGSEVQVTQDPALEVNLLVNITYVPRAASRATPP
jgi:hypothetical protein